MSRGYTTKHSLLPTPAGPRGGELAIEHPHSTDVTHAAQRLRNSNRPQLVDTLKPILKELGLEQPGLATATDSSLPNLCLAKQGNLSFFNYLQERQLVQTVPILPPKHPVFLTPSLLPKS
jgi:hypothetical protein